MTSLPPAPTRAEERIVSLDVLRGFCLLGVLVANALPWFSGRAFMDRKAVEATTGSADKALLFAIHLLVDGKAMTLLTVLFGLGFSLQLQRAESGGQSVLPLHLRRMAALAFIGAAHVVLLWWGDILWGYALAGMGLALFRRLRGGPLLACALVLSFLPMLVTALPSVDAFLTPVLPRPPDRSVFRAEVFAAIQGKGRLHLTEMHAKQAYFHVSRMWVGYFPWLLGRFLLGCWVGETGILRHPEPYLRHIRAMLVLGLIFGLPGSAITPVRRLWMQQDVRVPESLWTVLIVPSEIGVVMLSAAYACAVVLLVSSPWGRKTVLWIAPVGRMALTTYLVQSLVCTSLFYGFGLGLAGRLFPYQIVLIALWIFAAQVVFAHLWLRRFRYGPLEWLWRSMTYARIQPISRSGS
ncbi:MAG: DUF418 domain-containing protein [Polyangiaceae bacterium]